MLIIHLLAASSPVIDTTASSGTLWAVKAWHVEAIKKGRDTQADEDRSIAIIRSCNAELARRHGAGSVLAG